MVDWLRLFKEISKEVYLAVKPIFGSKLASEIIDVGAGGDMTRRIDTLAEDIVIQYLERSGVSCILESEECGTMHIGENPMDYVVLDGIDGTTNGVRGIPFVSTSIAHATGPYLRNVDIGLVMDLSRGVTFAAEKGKGSFEENKPLIPSSVTNLDEGLYGIELPGRLKPTDIQPSLSRLIPLIANIKKFRHLGSIALELCYLASGRIDGYIDVRGIIRATDLAAAYRIVKEAGALILTPEGGEIDMELKATSRTSFVAAANKTICNKIIRLITR